MYSKPTKKLFPAILRQLTLILLLAMLPGVLQAASPQARIALEKNPALEYAPDSILIRFKPDSLPVQKQQARKLVDGKMIRGFGIVNDLEHLQLDLDVVLKKPSEPCSSYHLSRVLSRIMFYVQIQATPILPINGD